jgi:hypothetical protein
MQTCKSCLKEIETGATKCSYCQAYQIWYKNPQHYGFIFMLPFLIFMLWNTGLYNKKEFSDFEKEFSFNLEKVISANSPNTILITYKIKNHTNYKWNDIRYEIVSRHDGELLSTKYASDFSWVIQPGSESFLTVEVPIVSNANEWELKIKNLEVKRY